MKKVFSIFMLLLLLASGVAFASAHGESSDTISKRMPVFDSGYRNNMMSDYFNSNHMNGWKSHSNKMWSHNSNNRKSQNDQNDNMWSFNSNMRSSQMNYWDMNTIHKEEIKEESNHGMFSWFWF